MSSAISEPSFNDPERVAAREELIAQGRYPALQALARMRG
jgi:hypothetical protein